MARITTNTKQAWEVTDHGIDAAWLEFERRKQDIYVSRGHIHTLTFRQARSLGKWLLKATENST